MKWSERQTGDMLVLLIAATVCWVVFAGGATIAIIAIVNPDQDTSSASNVLADVTNTLIGLLAGFLAGRTDATATERQRAEWARQREQLEQSRSIADETLPQRGEQDGPAQTGDQ